VVVVIHGGAWTGGNKDGHDPQIKQLASRGYLAVTVGYRLAPQHPFPTQIEDCKCAVRWLRANADQLGIDAERIGALGFSAGAHLAMMLGVMDPQDGLEGSGGWSDQSSKVQAVVSFAGPTDLSLELPAASSAIVEAFLGGKLADKQQELRQASPVSYTSAGDAPMLLFQGTSDDIVPCDQAFAMTTALSKAGVPGRVELLIGAGHGWGQPEVDRTFAVAYAFLDQYLRPGETETK
jgi:acetyl esterase/lipase